MITLYSPTVSVALVLLAIVLTVNQALAQKDDKGRPGDKRNYKGDTSDVFGRPKQLDHNARGLYIWCDREGWHLRFTTRGMLHFFTGAIQVKGGKITAMSNANLTQLSMNNLRHRPDIGVTNAAHDTIAFKFSTKGGEEGFDFAVDEAATDIEFRILEDGNPVPDEIHIGANGKRPSGPIFSLPAHPQKNRAKPDKEAKSK